MEQRDIVLIGNGNPLCEISVKSLAGYLKREGIPCRSIYMNECTTIGENAVQAVTDLCRTALLVGFSLMSKDVKIFQPLFSRIRELGVATCWGGIHATAMTEQAVTLGDFACVGEGEVPLAMLYRKLIAGETDYENVPNVAFMRQGQVVHPSTWWGAADLDALPFPDYELENAWLHRDGAIVRIPEDKTSFFKTDHYLYYSARGCPNACAYCSNSLYHKLAKHISVKWYREKSARYVVEEIKHILKILPCRYFWFNEDDFLKRSVEDIRTISGYLKSIDLPFNINGTPNVVTEEKIALLAANGCNHIGFGVQTGSDRLLKNVYKRAVFRDTVLNAAKVIAKYTYKPFLCASWGFIIQEDPYQTPDDQRETLRLIFDLPQPSKLNLYSMCFFPGTNMTLRALREGLICESDIGYNKDYREALYPSYEQMLMEAYYTLQLPREECERLLRDEYYTSEEGHFPRMILANFFYNKAVREFGTTRYKFNRRGVRLKQSQKCFLLAAKEIFSRYARPDVAEGQKGDWYLRYAGGEEIVFKNFAIRRWGDCEFEKPDVLIDVLPHGWFEDPDQKRLMGRICRVFKNPFFEKPLKLCVNILPSKAMRRRLRKKFDLD